MKRWTALGGAGALVLGLGLGGCLSSVPATDTIRLSAPAGTALPLKARVMVFASDSDLQRNLRIQLTRFQDEETKIREGLALAGAARIVLAKAFERVEINDPANRPHIVVRLIGNGSWLRQDASLKIGCGIDAWTSDGVPLGNFVARYDGEKTDYRTDLEPAFAQCLKGPVEELLRSQSLAKLAAAGFRDPPGPAYDAWMRTLGAIPVFK